jgi:hypothetical protein
MYAMEFHTIFFYNCLITKIQNDQIKYFGQTILAFLVLEILNNVCYAIISHHDVTLRNDFRHTYADKYESVICKSYTSFFRQSFDVIVRMICIANIVNISERKKLRWFGKVSH